MRRSTRACLPEKKQMAAPSINAKTVEAKLPASDVGQIEQLEAMEPPLPRTVNSTPSLHMLLTEEIPA